MAPEGTPELRSEHERAAELLPWLVNGTLAPAERELVERHVKTCLPCRAALRAEQRLAALVQAQPTVPVSASEGFERLSERIPKPRRHASRHAPWLLATAAALALAAWLAVDVARPPPAPEFATLSSANAPARGARIDIVFAAETAETDVRDVVRELGGSIVDGPNAVGRYTVALPAPVAAPGELDALLERLGRDPRVRFAARSFATEPSQ